MINDAKKEEVRDAADIVEVVSDYVKLKRSGSNFLGLCPYHNEKTPSFNVTPRLGIYKCFGCGETGDVFKFVMDQEGVGFTESVKMLADRYGVFIPEEEQTEEQSADQQLREGIYHALKFAGRFFYQNLLEHPDAEKARNYLVKRGYDRELIKKFGLGFSPPEGNALLKASEGAGIDQQYLLQADLIKPSTRNDGYYDSFRDRLMFPIFSPTNKVIAFAGRILTDKKTAKYINSRQTPVYNKSEVVYGVNFARNDIRKQKEVVLVEGYTDVITLHQHGIGNVVASSGTALTPGQMKILHRYGEQILMIYDADDAGQNAMKKGIQVALTEGMEVQLLELPEGEDPDSFVKQFGKESFDELKKEEASDFVDFLLHKAVQDGRMNNPSGQTRVISEVLQAIACIGDQIRRQVYVQHLHQQTQRYRKGTDRELFEQLERMLADKKREAERVRKREQIRRQRNQQGSSSPPPPHHEMPPLPDESDLPVPNSEEMYQESETPSKSNRKKPHYEKELIRLMVTFGKSMVEYVASLTNGKLFEDEELKGFYLDIIDRYKNKDEISIEAYSGRQEPFPRLLGDILLEQYTPSERDHEKTGQRVLKDKNPYSTAKSTIKTLELSFFKRKREELADRFKNATDDEKRKIIQVQANVQSKITRREQTHADDLYPDPPDDGKQQISKKVFTYTMRSKRGGGDS